MSVFRLEKSSKSEGSGFRTISRRTLRADWLGRAVSMSIRPLDAPDFGTATADDYATGTVAAACNGTTTIVDFCRQEKGSRSKDAIAGRHRKADRKAVIDYGFHIIVIDLNDQDQKELYELPRRALPVSWGFWRVSHRIDPGAWPC
jgi:hypothetical protein